MKEINIEWQHYDKEGETCTRCDTTGENIKKFIEAVSSDPRLKATRISFVETKLGESEMSQSNIVLINGRAVEDILGGAVSDNYCHSCTCLAGKSTNCRTIKLDDETYEDIPESVIKAALIKLLD